MKKKNKGFTLIELLAVIVILGLLMAIAIPSVTKYINQSRKKTLVGTINNYMDAVVNDVNDGSYLFADVNTIYAVPIECIAVEKGGKNPFGEWMQAYDKYWAYVLVQYDDNVENYRYAFTFKDSKDNGLYPTGQAKLEKGGNQIESNTTVVKPVTGNLEGNWENSGFTIDANTKVKVLIAELERIEGDGNNTCTLQQKGNNYDEIKKYAYNVIKDLYIKGDTTIYHHDGNNNTTNDKSYRYTGSSVNNYVCFGSDDEECPEENLYRIIGVFGGNVKLIKATSIGKNKWGATNDWTTSNLNVQLNGSLYYDKLSSKWQSMIDSHEWNIGGYNKISNNALEYYNAEKSVTWDGKIGLITASEFKYAGWLNLGVNEFTITRKTTDDDEVIMLTSNGYLCFCETNVRQYPANVSYSYDVRSTFYLNSNVKIVSGEGTSSSPYRLSV